MDAWHAIAERIAAATGKPFTVREQRSVGGGCINQTARLESEQGERYFVKFNRADGFAMFEAEADGLEEMARSNTIKVPRPICSGTHGGHAYLVLENLDLGGGGRDSTARLGEHLAAMHRVTQSRFGWFRDNTIGATPQPNTWSADWIEFWRDQRLGFQLELAARNGYRGRLQKQGEKLRAGVDKFFSAYTPQASLLHGDLWSGNYAVCADGSPVIFDPAVYYGDREADLAMTELFGGFPGAFYQAYAAAWPLDPGYRTRKTFYNLYHIINHLNLFGGGYQSQAERMIDSLLSEFK